VNRLNSASRFLSDLSHLLEQGLSLKEALQVIQHLPEKSSRDFATLTQRGLTEGQTLAETLKPWLKPSIIGLIRAGESSQRLAHALELASKANQAERQLLSACLQRLTYPLLVFILSLVLLVIINHHVLIPFLAFTPLTDWPSAALQIYQSATWLRHYGLISVTSLILMTLTFFYALGHWRHPYRRIIDTWPLWQLYRQAQAAHFLNRLSLLCAQGITLKEALTILSMDANPYLAWHLYYMQQALASGKQQLAEVLNTGLFDHEALARLSILGRAQRWEKALHLLSEQTKTRYEERVKQLMQVAAACCLILTAMIAGQIIFGIYALGNQATLP